MVLPVNNYTECYWKIDLKNLFHYIKLRADAHAQWEIQEFARPLAKFVKQHCPVAFEAFEDYWEQSVSLSRMDQNLMQAVIAHSNLTHMPFAQSYDYMIKQAGDKKALQNQYGLSKRELIEFEAKWQLVSS
jgi:thymidylate synthase ThyX